MEKRKTQKENPNDVNETQHHSLVDLVNIPHNAMAHTHAALRAMKSCHDGTGIGMLMSFSHFESNQPHAMLGTTHTTG